MTSKPSAVDDAGARAVEPVEPRVGGTTRSTSNLRSRAKVSARRPPAQSRNASSGSVQVARQAEAAQLGEHVGAGIGDEAAACLEARSAPAAEVSRRSTARSSARSASTPRRGSPGPRPEGRAQHPAGDRGQRRPGPARPDSMCPTDRLGERTARPDSGPAPRPTGTGSALPRTAGRPVGVGTDAPGPRGFGGGSPAPCLRRYPARPTALRRIRRRGRAAP